MTIDEAIKDFKSTQVDPLSSRCNAVFNIVCKIIDEWQWYRSQDLILREEAIEISTQMQWRDENGWLVDDYEDTKQYAKDWLEQVPKAEPPCVNSSEIKRELNETKNERNGDCETCKNITLKVDDICIECMNGANHYEPYIPKE